jgi:hypothetical protein
MNIIEATADRKLFRPFLEDGNGRLKTWKNWGAALRVIYGLPVKPKYAALVKQCTGRDIDQLPKDFNTILLLVGRRGGKSKISALMAAYEACLSGREKSLSKGELGLVSVVAPTRLQSTIIKKYIRAALSSPMLEQEIVKEDQWGFDLSNGVRIQILSGSFQSVRGFTQLAVIVDEACFFHLSEEGKIRSDIELIRAIRPALATTGGRLIAISTKYAKRGWAYGTWKKYFGNNSGQTLVWDADSRTMNPTLSQKVIDQAIAEDPTAARSEFMNQWREDVAIFLPIEVVESVVKKGRFQLLPKPGTRYFAFVDISGGRSEDGAVCIGHREIRDDGDKAVIVDCLERYKSPYNPYEVIGMMSKTLYKYSVRKAYGDAYAAEFVAQAFRNNNISYEKSKLSKSLLYLEFLPQICSGAIELLDDPFSIKQLGNLERRTRSGGKDIIDHPVGGKDDCANAISGLSFIASKGKKIVGCITPGDSEDRNIRRIRMAWARLAHVS